MGSSDLTLTFGDGYFMEICEKYQNYMALVFFTFPHFQYLQIIIVKEAIMAVSVKITDVVDPKTYWAYETESEDRQTKLKMVEKELKDQWPEAGEIFMISRPEGLPVIVLLDGKFCRGQIKLVTR